MTNKLIRTPGVYLVGFMGCGKTTVGRLLAEDLGWSFLDLDDEIERAQGRTIAAIFENKGEAEFRRVEREAVREAVHLIQRGHAAVLALGGGAFAQPANADFLLDNGVAVWLDIPLEMAWRRVEKQTHRPLARDRAGFEALYRERRPTYARADCRIEITGDDPSEAVRAILALPLF